MVSAHRLYDIIEAGLYRTRWRLTSPIRWRRPAVWLTGGHVEITDAVTGQVQRWNAVISDRRGHGFSRRQAKQIRAALITVMRQDAAHLEAQILAITRTEDPY